MARVFISHAGRDTESAAEVRRWLVDEGHEVFLDRDPRDGIPLGDEWERRLHERLRWADAVVCVVTSAYVQSLWCAAEVGAARSRGSRILPVVAESGVVHPLLRPVQRADMTRDPAAARRALAETLLRVDASGGAGWPDGASPFPGLVPFDGTLRNVFFGRSEEIGRFLELLRSPVERADGVIHLVVGPSGCGKSSLVRAGLVPTLAEEREWWTVPPFVPGTDPVGALARNVAATARQVGLEWTVAHVRARLDESGLVEPADEILLAAPGGKARRLLVVVDQLEELLTQTAPSERARLGELVRGLSTGPVLVVATLRSEFLDQLLAQPELADLRPRLHPVQPLRRQALRAVVEGPARIAGIRVEGELVDRLVADTDSGAALPLLAFTLAELADGAGRGDELSAARYDRLGGVRGALTRQADAALAAAMRVEGRSRDDVLASLLRLVTVDEQGNPTSWRVDRSELPGTVDAELEAFVARRLLVTDTADDGSAVIGVAHEAFLTAWPPLGDAIDAEASALRARRAVEHGAAEWDRGGRPDERLWERGRLAAAVADTGARLEPAAPPPGRGLGAWDPFRRRVVVTDRVPVSATARDFLRASIRRDRLRRGRATTVLSVLCTLALVAAGFAVERQRAAQEEQRVATARQLVAQADLARGSDPQTALMLDIAAERLHPAPDTRAALVDGLLSSRYAGTLTGHHAEVRGMALTADGRVMATIGTDGTVILWDVRGERPRPLGPPLESGVELTGAGAFSPDGHVLATTQGDHTVALWDVRVPSAPRPIGRPFPVPEAPAGTYRLAYSPDGRTLAVAGSAGAASTVELWDVSEPADARLLGDPLTPGLVDVLEFHPTRNTLITGASDGSGGSVVLWDLTDPARPGPIGPPLAYAGAATFHAPTRLLAVGTDRSTSAVTIWDLTDPAAPRPLPDVGGDPPDALGHSDGPVSALRFTPDAAMLAVASWTPSGGIVRVRGVTDPDPRSRYRQREFVVDEPVGDLAFVPDSGVLATVDGRSEVVTLWDLGGPTAARQVGRPNAAISGGFRALGFLRDHRGVLTDAEDGRMIVWELTDPVAPRPLGPPIANPGTVSSLAFSPGPGTLLVCRVDGSVWQHPVARSPAPGPAREARPGAEWVHHAICAPRTGVVAATDQNDGAIEVADPSAPSRIGRIPAPEEGDPGVVNPYLVGFSPDGRVLAVSAVPAATIPERYLALWDVSDPTRPRSFGVPSVPLHGGAAAAFSPDGRLLAIGAGEGGGPGITLIDVSDPTAPTPIGSPLTGHTAPIGAITFSPGGTVLATADDRSIVLWDVSDPARPLRRGPPLAGHTTDVRSLALSPDGRTLASGDVDGNVVLWDLADLAHPGRLGPPLSDGRAHGVTEMLFSADGAVLVAGSDTVTAWDLDGLNALRTDARRVACERTGRGLDPHEWARYVSGLEYLDTCSG